ncbi:MAG TPA: hypothetical protein VMF89_22590 [Polyangiales bacterium]|nr:hypothetical protein [Polyangiales bacterium]
MVELSDKTKSSEDEGIDPCAARATSHFMIRVNLDPRAVAISPWNPSEPQLSHFAHNAMAYADSTQELWFHYLPVCGRVWEYHVLDPMGVERGSGELEFNEDGFLKRNTELVPLRLLHTDGKLGDPVTIDYGPLSPPVGQTSSISIEPTTTIYVLEHDGHEEGSGPECL